MKNYECHAGIDVSKLKLDVSLLISASSNRVEHFIVPNNKTGIQQMLKRIEKFKISTSKLLVSFEDTGVYSLPLACFLSEAGLDYWMIPAIEIKRSKGISRGKNDKTFTLFFNKFWIIFSKKSRSELWPRLGIRTFTP